MPGGLASISFDGLRDDLIEGGEFTLAHGPTASSGTIITRPQPTWPQKQGTLRISQNGRTVELKNCLLDDSTLTLSGGPVVRVTVLDRRWKWAFGTISGRYNVYREDGSLDDNTEKSPQELVALLATAIGEPQIDAGGLPKDARPFVDWQQNNPARALAELADRYGFTIVLGLDDRVRLLKQGEGALLTFDGTTSDGGDSLNPPDLPDTIRFIARPDVYEWDFELEAVGRELNGEIVPIADLSYAPTEWGWMGADILWDFCRVEDEEARRLAQESVFLWYRMKLPTGGLNIPGVSFTIRRCDQIEWRGHQVRMVLQDGVRSFLPPVVYGNFYNDRETWENEFPSGTVTPLMREEIDYDTRGVYHHGFSVDPDRHLVRFSRRVVKFTDDSSNYQTGAADLRLRIAFTVRDETTGEQLHRYRDFPTGAGNGTKPQVVRSNDLSFTQHPIFTGNSFGAYTLENNEAEFNREAEEYFAATMQQYQVSRPQAMTWQEIRPVQPDGAIRSVSWRIGGVPETTARRNTDRGTTLAPRAERRWKQRTTEMLAAFATARAAAAFQPKPQAGN